jgi:hypothetical protein
VIVPTVLLPPAIPFTFHVTDASEVPCTVAVNCAVAFVFTVALGGEMLMLTDAGCTIATYTVFETSPSGVATNTGADDLGDGALPAPVSTLVETKVVGNVTPSTEIVEPDTKPAPFTVMMKLPVESELGLTEEMLGLGMSATEAVPLAVGVAVLVARTVTVEGVGTLAGAR